MLPIDAISAINQLEAAFPVEDLCVRGTRVWPLVRVNLGFELTDSPPTPHGRIGRWRNRARHLRCIGVGMWAARRWMNWHGPRDIPTVLFMTAASVAVDLQGRRFDRFALPIGASLPTPGRVVALGLQHDVRRFPRDVLPIQGLIDGRAAAASVFSRGEQGAASQEAALFATFTAVARDVVPALRIPSIGSVVGALRSIESAATVFGHALDRTRASGALMLGYHGAPGMGLVLACRRRGLTSVDVQHGVEGDAHPGYGRWHRTPADGYELLPDVFWCWSEYDRAVIDKWASDTSRHRAIVGGNPFLRMWQRGEVPGAAAADRRAADAKKLQPSRRHVLCSLSPGDDDGRLLAALGSSVAASDGWHWWIRLHPAMSRAAAAVHRALEGCGSYDTRLATELPLYSLLSAADAHLTRGSASALEARDLGVASVITSEAGSQHLTGLIASGWARSAASTDDICDELVWAAGRRRPSPAPPDTTLTAEATILLESILRPQRPGDAGRAPHV